MADNHWTQIKVTAATAHLDTLCAVLGMLDNGLMIEDYSDVEQMLDGVYGDLIDEEILRADRTTAAVSIFVPAEKPLEDYRLYIDEHFRALGIPVQTEYIGLSEEDWANAWKAYYKPIHIGKRLVIVPAWEPYTPAEKELIIKMDPGMAFGTGTHETTRLVASMLERYVRPGIRMLDVGCGSGILAICASKLGAGLCRAYDIDPVAVRVARENVADNGVSGNVICDTADLLHGVDKTDGGYDLITANIVADVIIRMAPDVGRFMNDGAVLIVSGIISERAQEVRRALQGHGLTVLDEAEENGWTAIALTNESFHA